MKKCHKTPYTQCILFFWWNSKIRLSWKSKFYRIFYKDVFSKVEPRTPEESQKSETRLGRSFIEFLFLGVPFVKFGLSRFLRGEGDLALLKDKIWKKFYKTSTSTTCESFWDSNTLSIRFQRYDLQGHFSVELVNPCG